MTTAIVPHYVAELLAVQYPWLQHSFVAPMSGGLDNEKYLCALEEGKRYLLKIYRNKPIDSVLKEMECLRHVATHGIPCQEPIATNSGADVCLLGAKPVCLFRFIEGTEPTPSQENLVSIGKMLALTHEVPEISGLRSGYPYSEASIALFLQTVTISPEDYDFFSETLSVTKDVDLANLERKMCHCDVFLDNLIQDYTGVMHVIDFEEVSLETTTFDIGRAVVGCCRYGDIDQVFSSMSFMLCGYDSIRSLPEYDRSVLHNAIVRAGMISTFWRYYTFEIENIDVSKKGLYRELRDFTRRYLIEARARNLLR